MNSSTRTMVLFVIILAGTYFAFTLVILHFVGKLNVAREDELQALSTQNKMLRRLDAIKRGKTGKRDAPAPVEAGFNFPLLAAQEPQSDDVWPASGTTSAFGLVTVTTPHFKLYGYNYPLLQFIAARIESYYDSIVRDAGLYEAGILPAEIALYVYRDKKEYQEHSRQPEWTEGCTFIEPPSIYTFEGDHLRLTIPHELTHLMLCVFLGDLVNDSRLRWVNEGLAVYEEMKAHPGYRARMLALADERYRTGAAKPLASLARARISSQASPDELRLWYLQAAAVIDFLITERTPARFSNFCMVLKSFKDTDRALAHAYAAEFNSLSDIEPMLKKYLARFEK